MGKNGGNGSTFASLLRYFVLVNGNPCNFSRSSRGLFGLRQGDPLLPIFILIMEALSKMMDEGVMGEFIKGFKVVVGSAGTLGFSFVVCRYYFGFLVT